MSKAMRKFRLHWSIHPEKTVEWYEEQKSRMTEDEVARDLDINYSMSVTGKVFASFSEFKHLTKTNPYNPNLPVYRVWDFGKTNVVLYAQIDDHGRKRILHERVIDGSDTYEQIFVAKQDSEKLFPDASFEDICDPSGAWSKDGMPSATIDILQEEGINPSYERTLHLPMRERKRQGRELINKDLQTAPGGQEALLIYVSEDGQHGCPTLKGAFLGGYAYKRDYAGNITDKIAEAHPYEDVIDCLLYLNTETAGSSTSAIPDAAYKPSYSEDYISPYLGY